MKLRISILLLTLGLGGIQGFSQAKKTFWQPQVPKRHIAKTRPAPPRPLPSKAKPSPPRREKQQARVPKRTTDIAGTTRQPRRPVVKQRPVPTRSLNSNASLVSLARFDDIEVRGSARGDKADPELAKRLDNLFAEAKKEDLELAVTDAHAPRGGHAQGSLHRTGDAADVAFKIPVKSMSKAEKNALPKNWDRVCQLAKQAGLGIHNETWKTTKNCGKNKANRRTTGPHLHLTVAE